MAKDLKLVEMVRDHFSWFGLSFANLNYLRDQLEYRSKALASLDQVGMPQPMKVLCVLLRELWQTRITKRGASKLADQPTSTLQDLCKLIQNAMEDWENVERVKNWCGKFCFRLWELRQSCGHGPPSDWNSNQAFEDLQVIQAEAQKIIATRLAAAADIDAEMTMEKDASKLNEEVQDMKSAYQNLKLQVAEIVEKLDNLQQNMSQYKEVFDHQLKMKEELMELNSENGHFKQKEAQLERKVKELEEDASSTKEVKKKPQGELLAMREELGQLQNENFKIKEELQELKLQNENMELRGLEVDGKVNQLEENNTLLSKQLHDQLQKLEDERLRMKQDRLKMKEELMECNSDNLKIMGKVVEFNSDKWKMKEALEELKSKCEQLKLNTIQADMSDVCSELSSWVQVHQDVESSMVHSTSSAFSVETNGPRCFMLDAVFKTPSGAFLSGTDL